MNIKIIRVIEDYYSNIYIFKWDELFIVHNPIIDDLEYILNKVKNKNVSISSFEGLAFGDTEFKLDGYDKFKKLRMSKDKKIELLKELKKIENDYKNKS